MKGRNSFRMKSFYTMLALGVMFLVGVTGNADAGSILIPVAEFTTDGGVDTAPGNFYKLFNGGYLSGTDAYPCLVAPVRIPNNATKINKVIVYLIDDNTSLGEPWFQLDAIDMATGTVENYTIGEVTTGTSTLQAIQLPLSQKALVKGRVYQLGTCLNGGQYLYGAKVVYTTP